MSVVLLRTLADLMGSRVTLATPAYRGDVLCVAAWRIVAYSGDRVTLESCATRRRHHITFAELRGAVESGVLHLDR